MMRWRRLAPVLCLLLGSGPGLSAQAVDRRVLGDCRAHEAKLAEYEGFVQKEITEKKIPGLTLGFFKGGCTWVAAFGLADLENRVPASVDSAYRYASVQKSMTAAAVLLLAEQGKVDLDAEVQRYVGYFPRKRWPVTVRQLLGHLGGLPHYVDRATEQHIKVHKTTREAIAIFEGFDLIAEPGTKYSYSSYGYNLLGAVLEGASGLPYGEHMRKAVWQPLGMSSVRLDDPLDLVPNRVRGYQLVNGDIKNSEFIDVSSRFAAGGTRGTVPDLIAFVRGIQEGRLLSAKSLRLAYTPMTTRNGEAIPYTAGGWQFPPFKNRGTMVANDGGQQETRTFILNDPDHGFGMALAMNLEADIYGPIVLRLYEVVVGEPLEMAKPQ